MKKTKKRRVAWERAAPKGEGREPSILLGGWRLEPEEKHLGVSDRTQEMLSVGSDAKTRYRFGAWLCVMRELGLSPVILGGTAEDRVSFRPIKSNLYGMKAFCFGRNQTGEKDGAHLLCDTLRYHLPYSRPSARGRRQTF